MLQWLKLHAPNAGGMGLIPGRGTKIPYVVGMGEIKLKKKKKRIGSGPLGPLVGRGHWECDFIHSTSSLLQVECNSKLDPTQTSFLKVSNPIPHSA